MSIFEKYAKKIDQAALAESQKEINENNNGEYKDVPHGTYEVEINKMECKKSKSGNPMVSIWFKILEGDYKGSLIFYNGVFYEDWMRHRVVDLLSEIMDDDTHKAEINLILKDNNVDEVNDFVMDLHEEIDGKLEYLLEYGQKKGYDTYKIKEIFEA